MRLQDDELREMLARRAGRSPRPDLAGAVPAATSDAGRWEGPLRRLRRRTGIAAALLAAALSIAVGAVVVTMRGGPPERDGSVVARPSASAPNTPAPSASAYPTATAYPKLALPPPRPPTALREVLTPAVPWRDSSAYLACGHDSDRRTVLAATVPGAVDRWRIYAVLPVRAPSGSPSGCQFAVIDDWVFLKTLTDGVSPQAWLVSGEGVQNVPLTGMTYEPEIRRAPGRVLLITEKSVMEVDRAGTFTEWELPPDLSYISSAAIDLRGRRWLLAASTPSNDAELWINDGSGWRSVRLGPYSPRGLVVDKALDGGATVMLHDEKAWRDVVLRLGPGWQRKEVPLPPASQTLGLFESGRVAVQQMTWVRVEPDRGSWGYLPIGLDEPIDPNAFRHVSVSGDVVVLTDRRGVRLFPASRASYSLDSAPDLSPLPKATLALTVKDRTGLVVTHSGYEGPGSGRMTVVNKEGRGTVLWVGWSTFHCQRSPTIEFFREGTGYAIRLDYGPKPAGGCDAMAAGFIAELRLSETVDAERVRAMFTDRKP